MQFLITAYDGTDEKALERRLGARDEHLRSISEMFNQKKHLYAAAILDADKKMIGSVLIVDFPTREDLDEYLKIEPYVVNNVWKKIEIKPCAVGPMFMDLHK